MKRLGLTAQLGLFVVLTVGAALAWVVGAGFFTSLWQTHLSRSTRDTLYEDLTVSQDGRPIIRSYSYAGMRYRQLPYRTLDGETIEVETMNELYGANLGAKPEPRRWYDGPRTWAGRVSWVSDGRMTPTTWRVIRDATDEGRTYFAGYDGASMLDVGYVGRGGFRGNLPAAGDQFALGPEDLNYFGGAHMAGSGMSGNYRVDDREGSLKSWCVYLIDGERVVEVDLRKRSVRTLMESPDVISLGLLYRAVGNSEDDTARGEGKLGGRLAVRLTDRIEVINPSGEERTTFQLPDKLRNAKSLTAYQVSDEQLLFIQRDDMPFGQEHRVIWLDQQGKVTQERTVTLAGYDPPGEREQATVAMAVVPVPMVITPVMIGPMALGKVRMGQAKDYSEALAQTARATWPPYLTMLAVCAAAAWWVARRQREHSWPHTGLWCAAVFLTGVPGLIAYLIEHRREARAGCPACGRVVPRKRDACAACGGAFPEPRLTGVEVFA
jgi:hypothetical protein